MVRQGAGLRRPRIPVNEKVGSDQKELTWTANSQGAQAGMTVRPERASLGNRVEDCRGNNSTADEVLGKIDVVETRL